MQALDTSVLARLVLGDDPVQVDLARKAVENPGLVTHSVLLELGWVLFKALKLPRETVAAMLEQIIAMETLLIENQQQLEWAIERFRRGADWADMVHLASCSADAQAFLTFDLKLQKQAGTAAPTAIRTLRD